jgi:hypothetical protein
MNIKILLSLILALNVRSERCYIKILKIPALVENNENIYRDKCYIEEKDLYYRNNLIKMNQPYIIHKVINRDNIICIRNCDYMKYINGGASCKIMINRMDNNKMSYKGSMCVLNYNSDIISSLKMVDLNCECSERECMNNMKLKISININRMKVLIDTIVIAVSLLHMLLPLMYIVAWCKIRDDINTEKKRNNIKKLKKRNNIKKLHMLKRIKVKMLSNRDRHRYTKLINEMEDNSDDSMIDIDNNPTIMDV